MKSCERKVALGGRELTPRDDDYHRHVLPGWPDWPAWGDWALYTASPLRAFEQELGVQAPVGFWDPLGYTKDGNVDTFKRRRETEIKHGRVSMYATMG